MKLIRKMMVSVIIMGVLVSLIISLLNRKNEMNVNNREKNNEKDNSTLIDEGGTSPDNDMKETVDTSDSVPGDTKGQVGLGDEYISNGIGFRVNSVTLTDADEEFLNLFPGFSDLTSWDEGCISTLDFAEMYGKRQEKNGEPAKFIWKPTYRLIMDIEFHNYNEYESVSPLGLGDFYLSIFFFFFCMADGEFVPKYNSVFHRKEHEHHVHDFSISAGGDYKATFVFNIYPVEKTDIIKELLKEGKEIENTPAIEFYGNGDLYIIQSVLYEGRGLEVVNSCPSIKISNDSIEKRLIGKYTSQDFYYKRMTYIDYLKMYE